MTDFNAIYETLVGTGAIAGCSLLVSTLSSVLVLIFVRKVDKIYERLND